MKNIIAMLMKDFRDIIGRKGLPGVVRAFPYFYWGCEIIETRYSILYLATIGLTPMSIGDYSFIPKVGAPSLSSSHPLGTQGLTINPHANLLFCPKFKWEGVASLPAVPKPKQQAGPSRQQILDWYSLLENNEQEGIPIVSNSSDPPADSFLLFRLCGLSKDELVSATLISNCQLIENIVKNVPPLPSRILHLPSSRTIDLPFSRGVEPPFDIFPALRISLTSQNLLHFDAKEITTGQLVRWLDVVSAQKIFQLPNRSNLRQKGQQNLLWFNSATFHTIEEWLANELQKTILSYYFSPRDRFDRIRSLKEHMIDKKAAKVFIGGLDLSIQDFKNMSNSDKTKISEIIRNFEESVSDILQEQMLTSVTDKKKKKKRKNKKYKKEETSLQKRVKGKKLNPESDKSDQIVIESTTTFELLQQPSDRELMKPLLDKNGYMQGQELISTKFQSFEGWEEEINSTQTFELMGEKTHTEIVTKSINATNITVNLQNISRMTVIEHKTEFQFEMNDELLMPNSFQEKRLHRNSSHTHIGVSTYAEESHLQSDKHESESINVSNGQFSDVKTKKKRKRKGQKGQSKVIEEFKEKVISLVMNKQLNNMLDCLSMQSNSSYESKVIAFERVRYFAKSLYPYGQAILFGSNAVGLSLPSSDIDIMLVDMPCRTKEELCDCLAQIAIYINAMGWVISCSTYFGAKVPLVKLQIDPSVGYFTPKCKSDYFGTMDPHTSCYLDMKDPSKGAPIKVDITISTEEGKVSGSTELMRNWLEQNTSLQRVLLALKYTLLVRGFSQNFKGGIGSYCLFVMVAAYFRQFKEERQNADCEILLDILKFYGEDFQNQLKVITLGELGSKCFLGNEEAKQRYELPDQLLYNNLLKIIDPLYGKLMSSSCFQFNLIKSEWRYIRAEILKIRELVETEIEVCFNNPSEISKLLANRKALEKWAFKLMSRMDYSVSKIIERSC